MTEQSTKTSDVYLLANNSKYPVSTIGLAQCAADDLQDSNACVKAYLMDDLRRIDKLISMLGNAEVTDRVLKAHLGKETAEIDKYGENGVTTQSLKKSAMLSP